MALPQKGIRKIVIGENTFCWKIKKRPSHNETHDVQYQIPIQHIDGGQLLLVSIGYCRSVGYNDSEQFPITPYVISQCIKLAIADGWKFKEKLPPLEKTI